MNNDKPDLKRRPRKAGRPKLTDTRIEDLTPDMEHFAVLIARGNSPAEARKALGISEYIQRRWLKVPAIQERINQLTDDEQSVVALNFLERKLEKFGGSATLMIQAFAVETRQALHEFFMEKIGAREISWANALALAQSCEEKFGMVVPKEKSMREIEISTFDLLRNAPGGQELAQQLEPAKVMKQTIRETREDV